MPSRDDLKHQQTLLTTYRRTLAIQLNQRAALGSAHAPPGLIHGIDEARTNIARIKGLLRSWGADVSDQPDDEEAISTSVMTIGGTTTLSIQPPVAPRLLHQLRGPVVDFVGRKAQIDELVAGIRQRAGQGGAAARR
ncbi:MAG: hypothetical protein H7Z42_23695 [Roseiflexaceae bacterium]|nr:hypothetical protein [Roseiflexaceae bacterium]